MRKLIVSLAVASIAVVSLSGCHSSDNKSLYTNVQGPKLTTESLKGGPMPASAQAIFAQKMQAVAATSRSAQPK